MRPGRLFTWVALLPGLALSSLRLNFLLHKARGKMYLCPRVCPDSSREREDATRGLGFLRSECILSVPRAVAGLAPGIGEVTRNVLCGAEFVLPCLWWVGLLARLRFPGE